MKPRRRCTLPPRIKARSGGGGDGRVVVHAPAVRVRSTLERGGGLQRDSPLRCTLTRSARLRLHRQVSLFDSVRQAAYVLRCTRQAADTTRTTTLYKRLRRFGFSKVLKQQQLATRTSQWQSAEASKHEGYQPSKHACTQSPCVSLYLSKPQQSAINLHRHIRGIPTTPSVLRPLTCATASTSAPRVALRCMCGPAPAAPGAAAACVDAAAAETDGGGGDTNLETYSSHSSAVKKSSTPTTGGSACRSRSPGNSSDDPSRLPPSSVSMTTFSCEPSGLEAAASEAVGEAAASEDS